MTPDDLSRLVGKEIGVSEWFEITQDQIDAFATATHDHQFIHTDPMRARETPFGGTIAHGFLTLSLLSAMIYQVMPRIEGAAMGVNYGLNRVWFVSPVKVGARVRGRFALTALDTGKPGEITMTTAVTVEIENTDKPALIAEWIGRRYMESA